MAIFKNSTEYEGYSGYNKVRVWTFVQSDCQSEDEFYVDQTWIEDNHRKFASICKSKCTNTNAHTKTTTTHSTPRTRTPAQDGSDSSGYEDDTEQPETEE